MLPSFTSNSQCSYHSSSLNFHIGLSHDCCVLFDSVDFSLLRGNVTGLVGTNGAGKTSLAKCIASKELPGFPSSLTVEYISSHENALSSCDRGMEDTPEEYILSRVNEKVSWLEAEILKLEEKLESNNDLDQDLIESTTNLLAEKYSLQDDLLASADGEIRQTLNNLGFEPHLNKKIGQLSCGWRYKCRLTAAFALQPDIVIIDEPSFLDASSTKWLVQKLINAASDDSMVLIISHKEELLKKVCSRMWYINSANKVLSTFNCGYEDFRLLHENDATSGDKTCADYNSKVQSASKTLKNIQSRLQRSEKNMNRITSSNADQRFIKGKNKEAKQKADRSAAAKVKQLKQQAADIDEVRKTAMREQVRPLKVHGTEAEGTIFNLQDIHFKYDTDSSPSPCDVFQGISAQLQPRDRILLCGPNGCGKSTLLQIMLGLLEPTAGTIVRRGHGIYFPQTALNELNTMYGDISATAYLSSCGKHLTETATRKHLGDFGLQGDVALRTVSSLSAGQRVRLWLAKQLIDCPQPSLLIMDEISENLDIETRQSLSDLLCSFAGAVVVVSHDDDFCGCFPPTQIWHLSQKHIQMQHIEQ